MDDNLTDRGSFDDLFRMAHCFSLGRKDSGPSPIGLEEEPLSSLGDHMSACRLNHSHGAILLRFGMLGKEGN